MTMEAADIAVIIPLYNGSSFIEQTLQSVFSQTLPAKEVIVVDDGSTDDGPQIVERIALTHPVRLLRKPNGGQSSARNFGIAHASAPLIALLDQDDLWYRDHLETLARPFAEARSVDLGWVYSNLDEIDREGGLVCRDILNQTPSTHPKLSLQNCLAADMFILPTASLISRVAFERVGGFDERLSGFEDDDFFLRLFRAGFDNIYIGKALAQWRIFSGSASFSSRMAVSRMIYLRKLVAQYPDDARRGRFYVRDQIAPRFFPWLVREFRLALMRGDPEQIRTAWNDLSYVSPLCRRKIRIVMALLLPVLRVDWLAKGVLPAGEMLQPFLRRILR